MKCRKYICNGGHGNQPVVVEDMPPIPANPGQRLGNQPDDQNANEHLHQQ